MKAAILEDDADRRRAFASALATLRVEPEFRDNAPDFIDLLARLTPCVISLDFDLFLCESKPDPGTGMVVVEHLVQRPPIAPVLVHSANPKHADPMVRALQAAGWTTTRINPVPDDGLFAPVDPVAFIGTAWIDAVRTALGATS